MQDEMKKCGQIMRFFKRGCESAHILKQSKTFSVQTAIKAPHLQLQ